MTSRERFLATVKGGAVDRFFRYEHGPWPTTRCRWIDEGYPAKVDFREHFHMDPLVRLAINSGFTHTAYQPRFERRVLQRGDGHEVIADADGVTKKVLVTQGDTSMPQFMRFPVETRDDWTAVRERLNPDDADARIGDVDHLKRTCADPDVPVMLPICGAYGQARNLFGEENLAYLIYDDPALLEEVLDNWLALYTQLFARLTEHVRVDAVMFWEDMCFKNGPLMGPEHVRRFMLPRYRKLIDHARACGIPGIIVDTDGDCRKLIPLFLEAGVDGLMPFEVQAGMDVTELAEAYPQMFIMGGLDKRALAVDREAIEAEVDRVVPAFLQRGRFMPCLDHTVPPNVSLAHFEHYLECLRSYE